MALGTIDPRRLRQQLARLSRNPYDLIQGGGSLNNNYMQRAPGMQSFPQVGQPQFKEQLIQKKTQPPSWWDTLMKPLFMMEKPLHLLGRAFSSGEYAVSSFLRSMIRASRDDAVENPFVAGMKGFAAGFHDDAEHQVRMTDILEIMGWRPEEGTAESFTKESLGFVLGVLADPITYASFGATRAFKLLPSTIKSVSVKTGIEVAETFAKGQAASKVGERVVKALTLTGTKGDDVGDLAKILKAEDAAKEGFIQLTLPGAGMSAEELIKRKTPALIDTALQAMGRTPTQAAREWFVKDGYRTLLDRGGLKFMGKTIASTKHLGPRMSGLIGLVAGNALSRNMPLTHMMMESKFAKKGWEAVTAPIKGVQKIFGKSFIRASKLAGVEPDWLLKFEGGLSNLKTDVKKTVATLLGSQRTSKITINGKSLSVPMGDLDFITRKEGRLLL
ncbi:MAG: hypothetical protein U9M89_02880, partial [Patescibacteria group bacterium]|nr:hypothetical protein [Patescibacteria group bacterium]